MEVKSKLTSCSCSVKYGGIRGFSQFKSDALFLVDPHQRAQLDMASLQDYLDSWFILPKVDSERILEFAGTFRPAIFRGEVEGSIVSITEEYVSACLKLVNSSSPDAASDGEKNVHRVSARSFVEFREFVEECFEGGSSAEVCGKGWQKSLLRGRCKDLVSFLQQRMWLLDDDPEFVDDIVVQAALGVMKGKQFAWAQYLSRRMKEDLVEYMDGDEEYRSTTRLPTTQYLSMLIEFQIGSRRPPPDTAVSIFDVDEMLRSKEEENATLLRKLAAVEEQGALLRHEVSEARSHALGIEEQLKLELLKLEAQLAQVRIDHSKEQTRSTRKLEEERSYSKIVYDSYVPLKSKRDNSRRDLKEAEGRYSALLEKMAKMELESASQQRPVDPKQEGSQRNIGVQVSPKKESSQTCNSPEAMIDPTIGTLWKAVWATSDSHYLGHFSNLFNNRDVDFPYPKWEALWWIAKD